MNALTERLRELPAEVAEKEIMSEDRDTKTLRSMVANLESQMERDLQSAADAESNIKQWNEILTSMMNRIALHKERREILINVIREFEDNNYNA